MEVLRKLEVKRREELWCKALKVATFDDVLKSKEYVTVKELKAGTYNLKKVPLIALEVRSVETVGNCYQVILRDASENEIQASFHPSCRDIVVKQVRKGRIMILKEVAMFSMGGSAGMKNKNYVLIVMNECIVQVVKH